MAACVPELPPVAMVPLALVRPMLAGLASLGADVGALCACMGVSSPPPADACVARHRFQLALEEASRALNEPELGLRLAQALPVGAFGLTEYCGMTSATLRDGLQQASRFMGLLSERMTLVVYEEGDEARIVHRLRFNTERVPHLVELAMATLAARCRDAIGDGLRFRRACFTKPPPADPALYVAHFRAPVVFDATVDELVLDARLLDAPLRTADPAVARLLATQTAQGPRGGDAFLDDVREAVKHGLERGDVHVAATAASLALSVRTLQRRLGELGMPYSSLVDEARRDIALQLVGRRTTGELTRLLGFSNQGAFFRAFRRWTGTTPRAHVVALSAAR
jgi:AraC-like DNA-binding protein